MSDIVVHPNPENSELIKRVPYDALYNPDKLFPISRKAKRKEIGIEGSLPFFGIDLWNHYEVSWLNEKGKPIVGLAEIIYGCESPSIIESKSMKLYFNTFNNTQFKDERTVENVIRKDLEAKIQSPVQVKIIPISAFCETKISQKLMGICVDDGCIRSY